MHCKRPLLPPLICLVIVTFLIAPLTTSNASETGPMLPTSRPIEDAVAYLLDQVDEAGCIGGARVTAWATMAVAAAGFDPQEPAPSGASLEDGLRACEPGRVMRGEELTAVQRHLLAIVAAGEDPGSFNGRDWEQEIRNHATAQGFFDPRQPNSLNNDIFGILSLLAAGAPLSDIAVQNAADRLLSHQNGDGGWSHTTSAIGTTSDTDMTGAAITALVQAGRLGKGSEAMEDALAFLEQRTSDTDESDHPGCLSTRHDLSQPDPDSTSWALLGLLSAHQDPRASPWTHTQDPWQCLLSLQHEDGGFPASPDSNPAPWPTAYTILALTGSPFATVHPGMQRPQAEFTVSSGPTAHQEIRLKAEGVPFASWRHEENGTIQTGTTITWTPDRDGIHNFTILLIDDNGLAAQARYPVLVLPEPPDEPPHHDPSPDEEDDPVETYSFSIHAPSQATTQHEVWLRIEPSAPDVEHQIDWGDGTITTWGDAEDLRHEYPTPGTYTISVWAQTPDGTLHGPEQAIIVVLESGTQDAKNEPLIPEPIPVPGPVLLIIAALVLAGLARPRKGVAP